MYNIYGIKDGAHKKDPIFYGYGSNGTTGFVRKDRKNDECKECDSASRKKGIV